MRANELLAPLPHPIAAEPGQHASFRRAVSPEAGGKLVAGEPAHYPGDPGPDRYAAVPAGEW